MAKRLMTQSDVDEHNKRVRLGRQTAQRMGLSTNATPIATEEPKKKRSKWGNKRDEEFDSIHERKIYEGLLAAQKCASNPADRPVLIDRQVVFELTPAQHGERAWTYIADFVVLWGNATWSVLDAKSEATRKEPAWVHKRKMMLDRYGIKVVEV